MNNKKLRRVGVFGGTFNPIHLGHLRAAEEIREILSLNRIIFIPSSIPPHKKSTELPKSMHRLRMVELATNGNSLFDVSEFEIKKKGISYTIDTLKYFKKYFPEYELFFLLGTELFSEIDTWKEFINLFDLANFSVIKRPGYYGSVFSMIPLALQDKFHYYRERNHTTFYINDKLNLICFVEIAGLQISSSQIREFIRKGKSIKYMVPDEVESYIISNKLYSQEANR